MQNLNENLENFVNIVFRFLSSEGYITIKSEIGEIGNSKYLIASIPSKPQPTDTKYILFDQKTGNEKYYSQLGFGKYLANTIIKMKSVDCQYWAEDNLKQTSGDNIFYCILYLSDEVELINVDSVSGYLKDIYEGLLSLDGSGIEQYYRGQIAHWPIIPSLFREQKWVENEAVLNEKIISDRPSDFADCHTHFEKLVRLKHYNQPSRLLDLSANPLVGLYFACEYGLEYKGHFSAVHCCFSEKKQEKYASISDTVDMLTALTRSIFRCSKLPEDQGPCINFINLVSNNDMLKLCSGDCAYTVEIKHQIVKEVGKWESALDLGQLDACIVVHPPKNNHRIVQQQGLFIFFGRNSKHPFTAPSFLDTFFRFNKRKRKIFIIQPSMMSTIQYQLSVLGINKYYIYGDLDQQIEIERQRMLCN